MLNVPEEYFYEDSTTSDSIITSNEIFQRTDISTWTASTDPQEIYEYLLNNSPWIDSLSTVDEEKWRIAVQMTLNILDYLDADSDDLGSGTLWPRFADIDNTNGDATFHVATDPESESLGDQRVYGVDNSAGLSALKISFNATRSGTDINHGIEVRGKLVNPFSTNASDANGVVTAVISYTLTGGDGPYSRTDTAVINISGTTTHDGAAVGTGSYTSPTQTASNLASIDWKLSDLTIKSIEVRNTNGSNPRLVRKYPIKYNSGQFIQWANTGTTFIDMSETTASYEVMILANDPVFSDVDGDNTTTEDGNSSQFADYWSTLPVGKNNGTSIDSGTITNDHFTNPTNASYTHNTGKIYYKPEAPVAGTTLSRLGHLGKIHSPHTQNRTVRFWSKFSSDDGLSSALTEGSNANGRHDGYLLDMFKIGTDTEKRGIINLNGAFEDTFHILFADEIIPKDGADRYFTVESAVNGLMGSTGVKDLLDGTSTSLSTGAGLYTYPYARRGDINRMFIDLLDADVARDDWQDNMIDDFITRFIEFTGTRHAYYSLYTSGISFNPIQTSAASFKVTAASHSVATVFYDTWTRKFKVLSRSKEVIQK